MQGFVLVQKKQLLSRFKFLNKINWMVFVWVAASYKERVTTTARQHEIWCSLLAFAASRLLLFFWAMGLIFSLRNRGIFINEDIMPCVNLRKWGVKQQKQEVIIIFYDDMLSLSLFFCMIPLLKQIWFSLLAFAASRPLLFPQQWVWYFHKNK